MRDERFYVIFQVQDDDGSWSDYSRERSIGLTLETAQAWGSGKARGMSERFGRPFRMRIEHCPSEEPGRP